MHIHIMLYCCVPPLCCCDSAWTVCLTFAEGAGSGSINLGGRSSFLERASSPPEDVIRDVFDGAEALAAFNVVNTVSLKVSMSSYASGCAVPRDGDIKTEDQVMPLQGDAKDKVLAYAEEHSPDLLIIGRSLGSRLKKVSRSPRRRMAK